jgi:protein tyrosine phosphatase (PTP) superfamily phosphohydrolase (DUF442 family)
MDAPPPPRRRLTRRTLLKLAGAGLLAGLSAEAVRVLALTNRHTVIDGQVYRTAQLDAGELARFIAEKKIRTVINLRGTCPDQTWYLGEARATHAAGICQEDVTLSAKRLPAPAEVRRLVEVLDHTEYPVVIHCIRGADRTGLVSAVAVILRTDASLSAARRQLWPRYGHFAVGRTAVIDRFFDLYEAWLMANALQHTPDRFRQWVASDYCPGPYRAELTLLGPNPPEVPAGQGFTLTIHAKNVSVEPWEFRPGASGGIQLRHKLYTPAGERLYVGHAGRLNATVRPGESIDLTVGFPPVKEPGHYLIHADLLDTGPIDLLDADFVQYGSEPLVNGLRVK